MAQFTIRIPDEMRGQIKASAEAGKRSMNGQIEWLLGSALALGSPLGVNRFEVIEGSEGRVLTRYEIRAELSLQDDGRTLKVFLSDRKEQNR